MTILHLKSKAGPDGKVHLGDMDVGVPHADVDITLAVNQQPVDDVAWKAEMRKLLDDLGDVHLEELPRTPLRDPWKEE
jgi:hypothetical protein